MTRTNLIAQLDTIAAELDFDDSKYHNRIAKLISRAISEIKALDTECEGLHRYIINMSWELSPDRMGS